MSDKKATDFPREIATGLKFATPCYRGQAVCLDTSDGTQAIVIVRNRISLREIAMALAPGLELDVSKIYPVAMVHRDAVKLDGDDEEL